MNINQRVIIKDKLSAEAIDLRRSKHPDKVGIIYSILEDAQNPYFLLREDTEGFSCPLGGFSSEDLISIEDFSEIVC